MSKQTSFIGRSFSIPVLMRPSNLPGDADIDKSFKSVRPRSPAKRSLSPAQLPAEKRQKPLSSSTRSTATDENDATSQEVPPPVGRSNIEQKKKGYGWLLDFD